MSNGIFPERKLNANERFYLASLKLDGRVDLLQRQMAGENVPEFREYVEAAADVVFAPNPLFEYLKSKR